MDHGVGIESVTKKKVLGGDKEGARRRGLKVESVAVAVAVGRMGS